MKLRRNRLKAKQSRQKQSCAAGEQVPMMPGDHKGNKTFDTVAPYFAGNLRRICAFFIVVAIWFSPSQISGQCSHSQERVGWELRAKFLRSGIIEVIFERKFPHHKNKFGNSLSFQSEIPDSPTTIRLRLLADRQYEDLNGPQRPLRPRRTLVSKFSYNIGPQLKSGATPLRVIENEIGNRYFSRALLK
jgi:hypothetical protein